jgi:hypothetical protein
VRDNSNWIVGVELLILQLTWFRLPSEPAPTAPIAPVAPVAPSVPAASAAGGNNRSATPEATRRFVRDLPKNTQRMSSARSDIPPGVEHREFPCLKCSGEVANFPDLICWDNPASVSGKCGDCVRKHGNCFPVITFLGSSTIS